MITPTENNPFVIGPPMPGSGPSSFPPPPGFSSPSAPSSGGGCSGCSGKTSNNFSTNQSLQAMNNQVQSWYDIPLQQPVDPRILIANSFLDGAQGTFARNNAYTASSWAASPLSPSGSVVCSSLHTDDALAVAEAAQWTFSHQGLNLSATNPPSLQKVIFLRGGTSYEMKFDIDFGAGTHSAVMLSFRDNAATPGDFTGGGQGTIPVISFPNTYTGIKSFKVTLKMLGTFVMGLRTTSAGSNHLFEMEWVIVP